MSVVLPAPFGPRSPKNSPGATSRSTPSRATTGVGFTLYRRRTPRASMAGGPDDTDMALPGKVPLEGPEG